MNTEILVHVTAPSRLTDDKRYLAIAHGVLNFEAATKIKITGHNNGQASPDSIHSNGSSQLNSQANDLSSMPSHRSDIQHRVRKPYDSPDILLSLTRDRSVRNSYGVSKPSRAKGNNSQTCSALVNPPYKSPVPKALVATTSLSTGAVTPQLGKSNRGTKTAKVLVPETEQRIHKRSWSAAFDDELGCSVRDSQSTLSRVLESALGTQSKPGNDTILPNEAKSPSNDATDQPQYILRDQSPETNGPNDNYASHINENSISSGAEDSTTATVSPSQNDSNGGICGTDLIERGKRPSFVDLITPINSVQGVESSVKNTKDITASGKMSIVGTNKLKGASTTTDISGSDFPLIKGLAVVIDPPKPNPEQFWLPARKQPVLKATADALMLPKRFKPGQMSRAVATRERGYWLIPFHVVTSAQAGSRDLNIDNPSQPLKAPAWRPLLKFQFLTEQEFVVVWNDLHTFISSGNAGWNVRLVRRKMKITRSEQSINNSAQFHLQVYCYGEDIPCVYGMLLLCTRMYALCKPLQWFSAVDENPIITMTGNTPRKEDPEEWTSHEDRYGTVFWGMAGATADND